MTDVCGRLIIQIGVTVVLRWTVVVLTYVCGWLIVRVGVVLRWTVVGCD